MSRSQFTDPLLSHNFALMDMPVAANPPLAFPIAAARSAIQTGTFIGFKSVEIPDVSIELREIKEGNWPYIHNVSTGFTTTGQAVLTYALFPTNFEMWLWMRQAILGRAAPRRSLFVINTGADKQFPRRILTLQECLPVSWKPCSSLDASSSEVLLEELTLDCHSISIVPVP